MKTLFLFIAICISSISIAQSTFKPGHYTTLQGERIDCLIKNNDWLNSPEQIQYKLNENGDTQTIKTSELKNFEIDNYSKYITANINVDESLTKTVTSVKRRLLIQVIIEGKASLYSYNGYKNKKYFYSVDDSEVVELIHKEYTENNFVKQNNDFLVKLNNDVKCVATDNFVRIKYNKNTLKKHFEAYNACKNSAITFEKTSRKVNYKLNVLAGFNQSSIEVKKDDNANLDNPLSFDSKMSPTVAIELEAILPGNNYKNAVFVGLGYTTYKSEGENIKTNETLKAEYTAITFNLGVRHYMFLNQNSKLLLEANGTFDVSNSSDIQLPPTSGIVINEINTAPSFSFGAGYKYQKFGATLRYYFNRELSRKEAALKTSFSNVSLLLSYNIL